MFLDEKMRAAELRKGERTVKLLLTVHVTIIDSCAVNNGTNGVVMIPFTGYAEGDFFTGEIVGTGVDTQKIEGNQLISLSARYMLAGKDYTGKECKIFIENNGSSLENCVPTIVTDSEALAYWQQADLVSKVIPTGEGVLVQIFDTAGNDIMNGKN